MRKKATKGDPGQPPAYAGGLGLVVRGYCSLPRYAVSVLISGVMRLAVLVMTVQAGRILDAVTTGAPLAPILWAAAGAYLVRVIFAAPDFLVRTRLVEDFRRNIRSAAAQTLAKARVSGLEGIHSGDTATRLANDMNDVTYFIAWQFVNEITGMVLSVASLLYGAAVHPLLAGGTVVTLLAAMYLTSLMAKPMEKLNKARRETASSMSETATDVMGGIETVKTLGVEAPMLARMKDKVHTYTRALLREMNAFALVRGGSLVAGFLPFFACIAIGGALTLRGAVTPGQTIGFALLILSSVFAQASNFGQMMGRFRQMRVAGDRCMKVLNLPPERQDGETTALSPDPVELQDVAFAYEGKPPVLQGVSLRVGRGERVALVGASGCGKSTLLKLVQGWYDPAEGQVRVFGRETSAWQPKAMRALMSVVPQDLFLFPATLRENLLDGLPDATDAQLQTAMDAGALTPALHDIGGVEQEVGERGGRLSGGQRQRAALARALVHRAPLLLLDEPTSALDARTENDVQRALDSLGRDVAVLVVAHRLRTVRAADRIYVLHEGRVAQTGRHEELIGVDGPYRNLFLSQAEGGEAHAS